MSLAERIRELRKKSGLTQAQVGEYFQIHGVSVSEWERGLTRPDPDRLEGLARLLKTSVEHLVTGREAVQADHIRPFNDSGEAYASNVVMLTAEENRRPAGTGGGGGGTTSMVNVPGARYVVVDGEGPDLVAIRKVKLKLSAGVTGFQTEPDRRDGGLVSLPRRWVEKRDLNPAKLLALEVKGQSMEPSLYDGDTVIINTADTKPVDGLVYAVNFEGEAVIKRMERDNGMWYIASDNRLPQYGRRVCHGTDCIIVGRVIRRETDQI